MKINDQNIQYIVTLIYISLFRSKNIYEKLVCYYLTNNMWTNGNSAYSFETKNRVFTEKIFTNVYYIVVCILYCAYSTLF